MVPFTHGASKQILAFPNDWGDNFGNSFYSHEHDSQKDKSEFEKMNSIPDSAPYKELDINVTDPLTLKTEIELMISEMREGTIDE
jgi:hypothetical protein